MCLEWILGGSAIGRDWEQRSGRHPVPAPFTPQSVKYAGLPAVPDDATCDG